VGGLRSLKSNKARFAKGDMIAGLPSEIALRFGQIIRRFLDRRHKARLASLPGSDAGGHLVGEGQDPAASFRRSPVKLSRLIGAGKAFQTTKTEGAVSSVWRHAPKPVASASGASTVWKEAATEAALPAAAVAVSPRPALGSPVTSSVTSVRQAAMLEVGTEVHSPMGLPEGVSPLRARRLMSDAPSLTPGSPLVRPPGEPRPPRQMHDSKESDDQGAPTTTTIQRVMRAPTSMESRSVVAVAEDGLTPEETSLIGKSVPGNPKQTISREYLAAKRMVNAERLWKAAFDVGHPGVTLAIAQAVEGGTATAGGATSALVAYWLEALLLGQYSETLQSAGFDSLERLALMEEDDVHLLFKVAPEPEEEASASKKKKKKRSRPHMLPGHYKQLLHAVSLLRVELDKADARIKSA
jgi:hypothetical protein